VTDLQCVQASQPKPHTCYHVSVRLPLRSYTLPKRYSDFTALQDQLVHVVGLPPPVALPKKHFLSSTLNNPALIEERRKGLEEYLQGIINAQDPCWRDSPPWRTFLNLPVTNKSRKVDRGKEEDWLQVHKQAKTLLQDARQHLSRRSTAPTIKEQHSASAAAKRCLVLAGTKVTALQNELNSVESDHDQGKGVWLGEGEIRRRRDLIGELNAEILGLERLNQSLAIQRTTLSVPNASEQNANPLFMQQPTHNPVSIRRVFGAPPETERTKGLDNAELLQLQTTIMKEQDDQMDEFLRQVRRSGNLAQQIHEELGSHLDLLEGLEADVDHVDVKIKRASKRADKLS
jgi:regulator of vacuolar morphogenesis